MDGGMPVLNLAPSPPLTSRKPSECLGSCFSNGTTIQEVNEPLNRLRAYKGTDDSASATPFFW